MPTSIASNSQTATLSTEHDLTTQTTPHTYVLVVDTANLTGTEILTLRIYAKARSGDTERLAYEVTYKGPQGEPLKFSLPVPIDTHIRCTLTQTGGTGRAYPWSLLYL